MSQFGDAALACRDPRDPLKWLPALKSLLLLPQAQFGEEAHASHLRDVVAVVLPYCLRDCAALPADAQAVLLTTLQRAFTNLALHPEFCTLKNLEYFVSTGCDVGRDMDVAVAALSCANNLACCYRPGQQMLLDSGLIFSAYNALKSPAPAKLLFKLCRFLTGMASANAAIRHAIASLPDAVSVLTSILAECIRRKDPVFPLGECRVDLAVAALQFMFALGDACTSGLDDPTRDDVTQLGILLTDILLLPHDIAEAVTVKRHVVHLLLYMPQPFASFLQASGAVRPLFDMFNDNLVSLGVEGDNSVVTEAKAIIGVLYALAKVPAAAAELEELCFSPVAAASTAASSASAAAAASESCCAAAPEPSVPTSPVQDLIQRVLQTSVHEDLQLVLTELVLALSHGADGLFEDRVGRTYALVRKLAQSGALG